MLTVGHHLMRRTPRNKHYFPNFSFGMFPNWEGSEVVMHIINSLSYMYPILFKLYCTLLFSAYIIDSLVHPIIKLYMNFTQILKSHYLMVSECLTWVINSNQYLFGVRAKYVCQITYRPLYMTIISRHSPYHSCKISLQTRLLTC